jgi:lysophospholipase L1-like esterase
MIPDCLIVGDSIAVGTHQFKPECAVMAKGGWNTWQWNQRYGRNELRARTVIISLGTNDHAGVRTEAELRAVRANAQADRVYWILPAIKPNIQDIVRRVAADNGDVVLPITSLQPDKIHPSWAGYKQIAKDTR